MRRSVSLPSDVLTAGGVGVAINSIIVSNIDGTSSATGLGTADNSATTRSKHGKCKCPQYGVTANRFMRIDIAPNDQHSLRAGASVMTDRDSLSKNLTTLDRLQQRKQSGSGIGSVQVNFIVNGDTDV